MRPVWQKLLVLFGTIAFLLVAAAILGEIAFTKWWESGCELTIYAEHPSPDGAWQLYVHQIDCGALSKFNTQASIQPAGSSFAPFDYPSFFSAHGYNVPLGIEWLDDTTVGITIPPGTEVLHQFEKEGVIAIDYLDGTE